MNELTVSPERLARLRVVCLALPEATEKVAWGDPTWRVKDKIFAMQKGNFAGGRPSLWLKAERGAQEALVGANPNLFFVPPYVGHKGWVGIYLDGARLELGVITDLVQDSYRLVAPQRLAGALGAPAPAPAPRKKLAKTTARAARAKAPARKKSASKPAKAGKKRVARARRAAR
jgi:predicted DNA-binding protein (MmcQ/YjbR family)